MEITTIDIPIYCGKITIVLDKDLSYVEKKYKTASLKNFGAVTLKDESKYRNYVVAFEYISGSIIAHEVVHLINYIYLDCGIELDRANDENQAYLTGWLFNEIETFLKNQ
jgi:hypothetical protein